MYWQPVEAPYPVASVIPELSLFVLCYEQRVLAVFAKSAVDILKLFSALPASYSEMAYG
jgi:hypothetical protein